MIDKNAPVGVFDSGVGGLTVAREIMRQLPDERIVYFADSCTDQCVGSAGGLSGIPVGSGKSSGGSGLYRHSEPDCLYPV